MVIVFRVSQNSYIFALDFPLIPKVKRDKFFEKGWYKIFLKKKLPKNLEIKKKFVPLQLEKVIILRRCSSVGQSS